MAATGNEYSPKRLHLYFPQKEQIELKMIQCVLQYNVEVRFSSFAIFPCLFSRWHMGARDTDVAYLTLC